jgi:hypothetical protein
MTNPTTKPLVDETELREKVNELVLDCLNTSCNGGLLSPTGQDYKDDCVDQLLTLITSDKQRLLKELMEQKAAYVGRLYEQGKVDTQSKPHDAIPLSVIQNKLEGLEQ